MASLSLTIPSSPNSLGLRFRRWQGDPGGVFCRVRFRALDRRHSRLVWASGAAPRDADRGQGQTWEPSGSSPDSFAGWSQESGGGGAPEEKFGGLLGAGLAGLFFASGVTFAAISLKNRPAKGVKIEPPTAEQEVLVASDDWSRGLDQDGNDPNIVLLGDENDIQYQNSDYEKGPTQDDMQSVTDVDCIPVPAGCNNESSNLISHDEHDLSPDVSSFPDPQSSTSSRTLDGGSEHFESQASESSDIAVKSSLADLTNQITGHQDSDPAETVISNPPEIPGGLEDLLNEPLSSSPLKLESGKVIDTAVSSEEVVQNVESSIIEDNIIHSQIIEPTDDTTSISVPLEHDISETELSNRIARSQLDQFEAVPLLNETITLETHRVNDSESVSALADPNGNESDVKSHIQINESSLFNSVLPDKSFSSAGIPAPSLVSAALQVPPGKVLVPAVVDQVQGQALTALQVLKVIEADVQPGDLCTRREYARWLVASSSALSRNTVSKLFPAMYIENVTELAFDDITPEDPDFACIQGLAEAGLISSKLSMSDSSSDVQEGPLLFSPDSALSRQDLVTWKMALDKRQFPEVDRNYLYQCSGYIDIEKINPDAWPALVADLSAGEQGIMALAFGYTRLFQPQKPVTKAQAAIALATGEAAEIVAEELTRIEAESLAETAVDAHNALVAQVEKDLHATFEKELAKEREKIDALEKLAEEARLELETLRSKKEEENNSLISSRAAVESEIEVLSRLRHEVEEQIQSLMSDKVEISFEKDRINKLREETQKENQAIIQLQYELEVERKALSMARAWAEEEAKKARENAKALEMARERWERHGIKVLVDEDLQEDASAGMTWVTSAEQTPVDETIKKAMDFMSKLKAMAVEVKSRSSVIIENIIQKIHSFIIALKQQNSDALKHTTEFCLSISSSTRRSVGEIGSSVGERTKRVFEDCKESVEKITQRFKT